MVETLWREPQWKHRNWAVGNEGRDFVYQLPRMFLGFFGLLGSL